MRQKFNDLKALGVTQITAVYGGSGDEGQTEEALFWAGKAQVEVPRALQSFFDALLDSLVNKHADGYENGDGGHGEVIVDVVKGTYKVNHNNCIVVDEPEKFKGKISMTEEEECPKK